MKYFGGTSSPNDIATKKYVDGLKPFEATYGVTTAAQIDAAYQEGRTCFVVKDNLYYSLYDRNIDGTHFTFATLGSSFVYNVSCNGSTWTSGYTRLATYTELTNGLAGKQDVLTFDNIPTYGSANPVKSGGLYSTFSGVYNSLQAVSENAAPAILNTATGAVASFPDGSASPTRNVAAEIVAKQDAPILPAGYWQLDYIESSGTQYIDTGYAVSVENMRYVGKFNFSAIDATMTWFGHQRGSIRSGQFYGPRGRVYAGSSNAIMEIGVLATNTDYSVDLTVNNGNATLIANGVTQTATYEGTIIEATRPIYLFGLNGGSGMIYPISGKCYYFKMYQGTTLVRDFVPCIRQADGVLGMYDLAGGAFYANAGTGDFIAGPPTSRPITGYTGANITRAGRNMLNEASLAVYTNWSKDLFPHGSYPTNNNSRGIALPVKAGTTYMLSFGIDSSSFPTYLYLVRGQGETSERLKVFTNTSFVADTYSFTAEAGWLYYIRLGSMSTQSNFETNWAKVAWSQMELGAAPTEHVSYAGEVFPVSWQDEAGTVYFGVVYPPTGALRVTHKAVDLSTLSWAKATSGDVVYFRAVQADKAYGLDNILCSCYQQGTAYVASTPDCSIAGRASSREVIVKDSTKAAMTAEEFAAAVSGQTLVYALTMPEVYILTPQQIDSLYGQNTLWNDVGGDTTVEYRADTKLYIQSLLGA